MHGHPLTHLNPCRCVLTASPFAISRASASLTFPVTLQHRQPNTFTQIHTHNKMSAPQRDSESFSDTVKLRTERSLSPHPMSRYPARDEFPKMTRDTILSMLTPIIIPHTHSQCVKVGLFKFFRSSLHPFWTEACFHSSDILDDTPVSIFRLHALSRSFVSTLVWTIPLSYLIDLGVLVCIP